MNAYSHRNADGSPKARLTRQTALARCGGDAGLVAYKCRTCHGWHVGHSGRTRPTAWIHLWDRVAAELNLEAAS